MNFFRRMIQTRGPQMSFAEKITILKEQLIGAEAIVIGAGAGLSTAAGYTYSGARFQKYFADFAKKYGFFDMYSGGFFPYRKKEEFWGFWSRNIWLNRYTPIPSDLYDKLLTLVKDKNYFVLTTNVDHCFQRSGFDKKRLFYTQGDYGLFQSSDPHGLSATKTYDNYDVVKAMLLAQGYEIDEHNELVTPQDKKLKMSIPTELLPICPDDGEPMTTNLRIDDSFVEDDGWHAAAARYQEFLQANEGKRVLFLELGVGMNTPIIIKFPFWKNTEKNPRAFYACVNLGDAGCSPNIVKRSVCLDADIKQVIDALLKG